MCSGVVDATLWWYQQRTTYYSVHALPALIFCLVWRSGLPVKVASLGGQSEKTSHHIILPDGQANIFDLGLKTLIFSNIMSASGTYTLTYVHTTQLDNFNWYSKRHLPTYISRYFYYLYVILHDIINNINNILSSVIRNVCIAFLSIFYVVMKVAKPQASLKVYHINLLWWKKSQESK